MIRPTPIARPVFSKVARIKLLRAGNAVTSVTFKIRAAGGTRAPVFPPVALDYRHRMASVRHAVFHTAPVAKPHQTATVLLGSSADELRIATEPLKRAPSQKELASILGVTTRHLRRWEHAENKLGRAACRPYTAADLWRLYLRRYPKKWNCAAATRLQLAPLFHRFEELLNNGTPREGANERSTLSVLMLKSLASDESQIDAGASVLPRPLGANLVHAAKEQLREILASAAARDILVRAYFEAALVADGARAGLAHHQSYVPATTKQGFA